MKGCFCPNCGKRQVVKLDTPSKVLVPCPECGKPLLIKIDKGKLSVLIDEVSHTSRQADAASPK